MPARIDILFIAAPQFAGTLIAKKKPAGLLRAANSCLLRHGPPLALKAFVPFAGPPDLLTRFARRSSLRRDRSLELCDRLVRRRFRLDRLVAFGGDVAQAGDGAAGAGRNETPDNDVLLQA